MKHFVIAAVLMACAGAAPAQEDPVVAIWSEDSGSLPPEYAWEYKVRFFGSGKIEVEYCKGYAEAAPGCATVQKQLDDVSLDAMEAEIEPYVAKMIEDPPQRAPDDMVPIGGGSIGGWILLGETNVVLPNFAAEKDAKRVTEVLAILQKYTPENLVKKATRWAKQP
jgi:hypothetical protein